MQDHPPVAIIGGTGFDTLAGFSTGHNESPDTPYGTLAAPLVHGRLAGLPAITLQRHGIARNVPPHRVNYRANLWALRERGVRTVIAVAAVGGIAASATPGRLVLPAQIIDYTWGRDHTFAGDGLDQVHHIDFTRPYSEILRADLCAAAERAGLAICADGVYGATQGPRLESAAEIARLERDGCTVVGMTGMPEASLARELDLAYACCAVVVNWAAGKGGDAIDMASIRANMQAGMHEVSVLVEQFMQERASG